jgi:hypothetical protein
MTGYLPPTLAYNHMDANDLAVWGLVEQANPIVPYRPPSTLGYDLGDEPMGYDLAEDPSWGADQEWGKIPQHIIDRAKSAERSQQPAVEERGPPPVYNTYLPPPPPPTGGWSSTTVALGFLAGAALVGLIWYAQR